MWRIIEIIKQFQNTEDYISLKYLSNKFRLTIRTIQNDVLLINKLLARISDCKIISAKQNLYLIGKDKQKSIRFLLSSLTNSVPNRNWEKFKSIILNQFWEKEYLARFELQKNNQSFNEFKNCLQSTNNYFNWLNINVKFLQTKKNAWVLKGSESNLRFLITAIMIENNRCPPYPHQSIDPSSAFIYLQIKKILQIRAEFTSYNIEQLIWFLVVFIRRNKKLIFICQKNNFVFSYLTSKTFKEHLNFLVFLIETNFSLKLIPFEIEYLKRALFINQKPQKIILQQTLVAKIVSEINWLIFNLYNLPLLKNKFKLVIQKFIIENWYYLLTNYLPFFRLNQNSFTPTLNSNAFLTTEIINLINLAFRKNNIINIKNNFLNEKLASAFDKTETIKKQQNWTMSFYILKTKFENFDFNIEHIKQFLHVEYSNIKVKKLNFHSSLPFMLNFINKTNAILIYDILDDKNNKYHNIPKVQTNNFIPNNQFKNLIAAAFKKTILLNISNSILIYKFFIKHYFNDLQELLWLITDILKRKFKINCESFALNNAFVNQDYCQNNIILLHKIIPIDNLELPIILIYFKNSISYKSSYQLTQNVKFVFITVNSAYNLFRYDWFILFIKEYQKNNLENIRNADFLYQSLNFS